MTNIKEKTEIQFNKGVTLIELIIVVVIIGILASIAYPSYFEYVKSANRADAQADLMKISNYLERYFTEKNTYVGAAIPSGIASDHYTYTSPIPNLTVSSYTLTAVPVGNQASDICGTMTLSQTGVTTPTTSNCWR
jgi:type IV pilus assembly protein PilE